MTTENGSGNLLNLQASGVRSEGRLVLRTSPSNLIVRLTLGIDAAGSFATLLPWTSYLDFLCLSFSLTQYSLALPLQRVIMIKGEDTR